MNSTTSLPSLSLPSDVPFAFSLQELADHLASVPDRRHARGKRYPLAPCSPSPPSLSSPATPASKLLPTGLNFALLTSPRSSALPTPPCPTIPPGAAFLVKLSTSLS